MDNITVLGRNKRFQSTPPRGGGDVISVGLPMAPS